MRGRKFALDRANGKILGVCAGLAETTGWDVTLIRVALVVVTIAVHGLFPLTLVAYAAAYFVARSGKVGGAKAGSGIKGPSPSAASRASGSAASRASGSAASLRGSMTELDRRLAEIETYVTSPNHQLASEIDALR
jgi:phage shock protein C